MAHLYSPYTLKGLELKNRVVMAPMCQYSVDAEDGIPTDWHFVHYVSRAVGGTGLIIIEMTDVEPDGRISNRDLGLWSNEHIPAFKRIITEAHKYGSKVGIQIAHAGRKAEDAEVPVAPSAIPVTPKWKTPRALSTIETEAMVTKFQDAARRAVEAGVDTIEIHGAHGYLIHQFHSPLCNKRDDKYGQDYAAFGVEVIRAMKEVMPADMPLIIRVSAVEYMDGGYDIDHMIEVCKKYKDAGVDLFHISSGGEGPAGVRKPANTPGYQVEFARLIKQAIDAPVIAVGLLDLPKLAEETLVDDEIELVAIGRGMLRDPYWTLHAIQATSDQGVPPRQYLRG
ncbi:NADH:flavin oxidoreductase/NADH oxidase [Paenibacillus sp. N1-5-1-14]|uniref:NADH:flavin oxidoreductase/NADH oxidase n=1 Tax=Paenibacillus radicibacter TaxID=2972488 RepID=UPI0021593A77|nr:NADH:flavin oxidoreductase/NADH oxidase [Paenibacillus radicibacter]MCR8641056.1 NADH:flavin oxidoreductase/NADH oxidase [Paenibacillus radicibacter]